MGFITKQCGKALNLVAPIFARHIAREMAEALRGLKLKVDVCDATAQLASPRGEHVLNDFFARNYRGVSMLKERSERVAKETYDFIDEYLPEAYFSLRWSEALQAHAERISASGSVILDLGVHQGWSTNTLAKMFPEMVIHGFDSFEGLPEAWSHLPKGFFTAHGKLPAVEKNVVLHKGWFEDTLPGWARQNASTKLGLMRVDCDIYSSTKTIFQNLGHMLQPGSLVLFDELIGYRGWRQHEYKALSEFLVERQMGVKYIAYGLMYVLVELTSSPVDGDSP